MIGKGVARSGPVEGEEGDAVADFPKQFVGAGVQSSVAHQALLSRGAARRAAGRNRASGQGTIIGQLAEARI